MESIASSSPDLVAGGGLCKGAPQGPVPAARAAGLHIAAVITAAVGGIVLLIVDPPYGLVWTSLVQ
jgi:hypothetical protein